MLELDKVHFKFRNPINESSRCPYPFQKDAMNELDKIKTNNPTGFSTMLVLPTGAGKTYTAVHWILSRYVNQGVKVLWIAHRSELLRQAAETFYTDTTVETVPDKANYISCVVSSEFGRSKDIKDACVVVASRQSIISGTNMKYYTDWARGKEKVADRKLLIVLDEAHHAACQSYKTIIKQMKRFVPNLDILGLTATPERTAKREQGSLKKIFTTGSGIAYSIDLVTLIKKGILADMEQEEIRVPLDMTEILSQEDFKRITKFDLTSLNERTLEKITKNAERNKIIVDTYLAKKEHYGKTIIFAIDVTNAIALNALFVSAGVKSDYVVSGLVTGPNNAHSFNRNAEVIDNFRKNKIDVIINVNILTEGTDIPDVQSVFLTRPTTSKILMTQMVGRGLRRTNTGKTKVNIVSFLDEWRGMVSFISPKFLLDGDDCVLETERDITHKIKTFINTTDIENAAVGFYENMPSIITNVKNIYPYGIIECSYITEDGNGNESVYTTDIMIYDEAKDTIRNILIDIEKVFHPEKGILSDNDVRNIVYDLYFKYAENMTGNYIGISSSIIYDLAKSFLSSGQLPEIHKLTERVDLYEIATQMIDISGDELNKRIAEIWNTRKDIHKWYDYEYYCGLVQVYRQRAINVTLSKPDFIIPNKEDMDMGTLKKYFPEYYEELREYVFQNAYDVESGKYVAARPSENGEYYSSPHKKVFEIDHIIPISKGGKTVKSNLQLLYYKDNRKKGNTI